MTGQAATVEAWIRSAREAFRSAGLDDPATDARVLVSGVLGLSATQLVLRSDYVPGESEADRLAASIERRCKREPVHRILGQREFYAMELALSTGTLEPRPDTEILVDRALPLAASVAASKGSVRLLDMGTGTGAIALAILANCPMATAIGSDISDDALATARRNADMHGVGDRFTTINSRWYDGVRGRFDMILSNPPYIRTEVISELSADVRLYDPIAALDGGADGLEAYRAIAAGAKEHLDDDGWIGVEIGYDQSVDVANIFTVAGFTLIDKASDYGGQDRVLIFRSRVG